MSQTDLVARRAQLRTMFEEMITAFGAKNFDHFSTFIGEDTVFEWPYLPLKEFPERMIGGSAFVAAAKVGMADSEPYNHKVDTFYDMADPDMLIVEYHSDTTHTKSGKRYSNKYLGILRYAGDQVVYWKEYVNPLTILEVYGSDFTNDAAASVEA
ncbi:nuclear transport factor 2 family protein [Sphingobium sp. WCS2017Hpa-17]|uniref:nuclear transport factor 2 family protein n=1 Tax=Sphingobium sp. WCS2017Hpa-17 TaxID=3073638 RepID=UPI00288C3C3D|nr:nuclear transport factor 2 family protein [Sphingobium sp. WCS2017Hpa-17]